ncbi:HpcH/HpaI aldolase/citrate lyase family protein|uniref:Citrate lyase subunit beta / citryl-CoA lyase n=1 Tax=Dendrosporobacter quercicolus TaxID=146817 RepID=A0A1G9WBR8_9FIRM|nr:aldolase/citrate lyase family protein [Dendrosporobacter quercicolus]NSL47664.1 HpcH/HpaI aldolase/citrate lyase family protein [Dendrosporobacter quercicolus DSM 1736]SDM81723.1 citrate lyase subunit beta / citryl-CoA lyase [Dendrosporobacter quercicolus]
MSDPTTKLRRTMMFVPANSPKMINNADIYGADSIMFDVEDAIAVTEKDTARLLISHALKAMKFKSETVVRINHPTQTPFGMDDLACILPAKPDLIRLPKVESVEEVQLVAAEIEKVEQRFGWAEGTINIIGAIESIKGLYNVREICKQPRFIAVALGAEDFIANIKTQRTKTGVELYHARAEILMAARNAEIQCFDTVFSDVEDIEGFRAEVNFIHDMGFDGKSVVHPKQIKIVNEIYTPTEKQIKHAVKVLKSFEDALKNNKGVISVDGKMIDGPIVVRAERVVAQAKAAGIDMQQFQ